MEKVPCQFVAGRGLLMRFQKDVHVFGRRGLDVFRGYGVPFSKAWISLAKAKKSASKEGA